MSIKGRTLVAWPIVACICFASVNISDATIITLNPEADSAMRDNAPDSNFGSNSSLPIGVAKNGGVHNRGLLRFDLTGIPANASINSVTLSITVTTDPTSPANFDLKRVLQNWDESQVTWNNRLDSTPWGIGGGLSGTDFFAVASATTQLSAGVKTFDSGGLISDVGAWVSDPTSNHGWILMANNEATAGTGKQFASREDPDNTPVLTVDYDVPPPPASPNITAVALVGNQIRFSFFAEAEVGYSVDFRDSLTSGDWSLLTTIPASPDEGTVDITNTISSTERYFRVRTP